MALAIRCVAETLRSLGFASVQVGYTLIGSTFQHPIRILMVQNFTDASLLFSLDGVNNHFPLLPNGYVIFDVSSNKNFSDGFFFPTGSGVYVKALGAPGSGSVYVSAFYGETV
jgi:hypothetical protein